MVARTVVQTASGAVLLISASLPATYDAAGYAASGVAMAPVGNIENYGNHGVTANITPFTPIDTATVTKVKGSKDYGTMSLMIGNVTAGDAGQIILLAASESNNHYSVEIDYPDGEIHYLDVLVSKFEYQDGSVNDVRKVAVDLAICRKPVVVSAP